MKLELINPFVSAAYSVLEMVLQETPEKGTLAVQPACFTSQEVNVAFGVTGDVTGLIIYGMSLATADSIASTMIGQPIKIFDALAASAVGELGNMISGNAMQKLSEGGLTCDITPPTVIKGTNVEISTLAVPAIVVPFHLGRRSVSVTVGLQESK